MFVDGKILTMPTLDRMSPGRLGVRICDRSKCFDGLYPFLTRLWLHRVPD